MIRWLAGASPGAKPWCGIDFAVFYLFASATEPLGKKGDASKSGRVFCDAVDTRGQFLVIYAQLITKKVTKRA